MPGAPSIADVNNEAHRLLEERSKERGIPLADNAVENASAIPPFSRGTMPLDDAGNVIEPKPAIGQGKPAGDITDAAGGDPLAEAKAELSGEAAPVKPRDSKTGKFTTEEKPASSPAVQAGTSPEAPPSGQATAPTEDERAEAAAEAAAVTAPDPWGEYEELDYEDPTLERTFKVRVPKADAQLVKGGYMRHADYSRKTMSLGEARKALQPLIEDGSLSQVLPLIRMGISDPEFARFIADAAARRARGEAMMPTVAAPAQAPVQTLAQPTEQIPGMTEFSDPYMATELKKVVTPFEQRLNEIATMVQTQATAEEQRNAAVAAERAENQRRINIMVSAHQSLAQRFPDEFTGDINVDGKLFQQAADYARESGYAQAYPDNPLALTLAWDHYRQTRAEAAASPAVAAVNETTTARAIAAATAAAVPGGGGSTPAPKIKIPPMPQTRVNGVAVDPKVYARQLAERNRAIALAQRAQ
jgi:hypothetical protein